MRKKFKILVAIVLIFTVTALFIQGCSLKPSAWSPPTAPAFEGELALNSTLQQSDWLHLNGWYGPEDFAYDTAGNIYCGVHAGADQFSPGAILKISKDGVVTEYLRTPSWVSGIQFNTNNELIALIHGTGLVRIRSQKAIDTLVTEVEGNEKLMAGSGLDIARDGKIYFANLSSDATMSTRYLEKLILEHRRQGGVYCYDPISRKTTTISEGNYFANGVALSRKEDYLLVSETTKYRIVRYWLTGEKAGTEDIFLDNLPGFPNNITRRPNGNFWVGYTTKRNAQLDKIHSNKEMKRLVYALPSFLKPKAEPFGMIIEYAPDGTMVKAFYDPEGKLVAEAGAVTEFEGKLYIGGDAAAGVVVFEL